MSAPTPVRLAADGIELEVLPTLGARMHRLRVFGHDLARTPAELSRYDDEPFAWGGYVMAPWCNRISPIGMVLGGRRVAPTANFADGTAIHGLVASAPFQPGGPGRWVVDVPAGGWPWAHRVTVAYRVAAPDSDHADLSAEFSVRNDDSAAMPAGIGWHPWFVAPVEVAIPARSVYVSNLDSATLPEPVRGAHDVRQLAALTPEIDATWTDLDGDVLMRWPDAGIDLRIESPQATCVVAAAFDAFGAVAVEPQTHAPNADRRLGAGEPNAPTWLAPGETLTLHATLHFTRHLTRARPDAG